MIKFRNPWFKLENLLEISISIMRGWKKQYGRFNVQNQNARGQVKHATPLEQRQFLIRQIERQEKQKALHAEEQRR